LLKEHDVQVQLFDWMAYHPKLKNAFAIPNANAAISRLPQRQQFALNRYMKSEGRRAGVPDIMIPCPAGAYHGIFVELKREKGGVLSKEQKEWIQKLNDAGYYAVVARGLDDAKEKIETYLLGK